MTLRQFLRSLWKSLGRAPTPAPAPRPAPKPAPVPIPAPVPPPPGDVPAELLAEHNARRAEAGLPPLVASVKLQVAAQSHADRMAQTGQMAHSGIGDGDLASRLTGVNYRFRSAGENVAMGQRDVAAVMQSWMGSPGHRANILGNFSQGGFAVAYSPRGDPFWGCDFGTPAIQAAYTAEPLAYAMGSPEVTGDDVVSASSIQVLIG